MFICSWCRKCSAGWRKVLSSISGASAKNHLIVWVTWRCTWRGDRVKEQSRTGPIALVWCMRSAGQRRQRSNFCCGCELPQEMRCSAPQVTKSRSSRNHLTILRCSSIYNLRSLMVKLFYEQHLLIPRKVLWSDYNMYLQPIFFDLIPWLSVWANIF